MLYKMEKLSLIEKLTNTVKKKIELIDESPMRYIVRAILATVFLTLATCIAFLVAEVVQNLLVALLGNTPENTTVAYMTAKIFYALTFGWALVFILFLNGELFTSNAMYFSAKVFDKTVPFSKALKVLVYCYIGNFIGSVLTAILLVASKTFTADTASFAIHVVDAKLMKEPLTLFLQGIIANLIVNMAVLFSLNLKDDAAKIKAILFTVFVFAFFGSEHVIANFSSFSLVGLVTNFNEMTISTLLTNFLFATLGNIIGGGFLIGIVYTWLNKGKHIYKD